MEKVKTYAKNGATTRAQRGTSPHHENEIQYNSFITRHLKVDVTIEITKLIKQKFFEIIQQLSYMNEIVNTNNIAKLMTDEIVYMSLNSEEEILLEETLKEHKDGMTTDLKDFEKEQTKIEHAVEQHKKGKISIGRMAEVTGLSRHELFKELKEHNVSVHYSKDRLLKEISDL